MIPTFGPSMDLLLLTISSLEYGCHFLACGVFCNLLYMPDILYKRKVESKANNIYLQRGAGSLFCQPTRGEILG